MFGTKSLALLSLVAMVTSSAVSALSFTYKFKPCDAAGVDGVIKVKYADSMSTKAIISADLDFSKVDVSEIQKFDGNCTADVMEYKWHIHVKWPTTSTKTSDKFGQCSKALTSNHYDPYKACGPNSEFAETAECIPKIPSYACNSTNYIKDFTVCEKGDLSGKFGDFKLDSYKRVKGQWVDYHYPLLSENTAEWNIILHGVCGKFTPRIACALGKFHYDDY
jgi:hypothetical protein